MVPGLIARMIFFEAALTAVGWSRGVAEFLHVSCSSCFRVAVARRGPGVLLFVFLNFSVAFVSSLEQWTGRFTREVPTATVSASHVVGAGEFHGVLCCAPGTESRT